jgi:crossover junction endodeoxyribonuclease RuvC
MVRYYTTMRILGIDPGSHIVGYGALDCTPGQHAVVTYGSIQVTPGTPTNECLLIIHQDIEELFNLLQPDVLAIEQLFFFRNVTTVIPVAQARGVVLLSAMQRQLAIGEYPPQQVKQSLTGSGRATKKEVQHMVKEILGLERIPKPDDAADALAIALTHAYFSGL